MIRFPDIVEIMECHCLVGIHYEFRLEQCYDFYCFLSLSCENCCIFVGKSLITPPEIFRG